MSSKAIPSLSSSRFPALRTWSASDQKGQTTRRDNDGVRPPQRWRWAPSRLWQLFSVTDTDRWFRAGGLSRQSMSRPSTCCAAGGLRRSRTSPGSGTGANAVACWRGRGRPGRSTQSAQPFHWWNRVGRADVVVRTLPMPANMSKVWAQSVDSAQLVIVGPSDPDLITDVVRSKARCSLLVARDRSAPNHAPGPLVHQGECLQPEPLRTPIPRLRP